MSHRLPPEKYADFRTAVRSVAEDKLGPLAPMVDQRGGLAHESYAALTASGLHAPGVPQEYGGDGVDVIAAAIAVEEVARVPRHPRRSSPPTKLVVTPLPLHGTDAQRGTYLPQVASCAVRI